MVEKGLFSVGRRAHPIYPKDIWRTILKYIYELAKPAIVPPLYKEFAPIALANRAFFKLIEESGAGVPLIIGLERDNGMISIRRTVCLNESHPNSNFNLAFADRLIKMLLWQKGGWKVWVCGPKSVYEYLKYTYSAEGARAFDAEFMGSVYENHFTVVHVTEDQIPAEKESTRPLGGNLDGCRIGFDLGASDRKVSAVIDGKDVYTEEVVWDPRNATDPNYHYNEINAALKTAASHMPRVDAIGGSSAGVYIDNRPRVASLFRGVPKDIFESTIATMFIRLKEEWGGIPFEVVNDGEVTALAGAMSLEDNGVLGIALGSSEAGGYVNTSGEITSWLNELAFCPVDAYAEGPVDEWSGDKGCGALYFSQQAVFRLAPEAGIPLDESSTLAAKLKGVQDFLESDDQRALNIWDTIGIYMGYGIAHYSDFYDIKHALILGRVTSGRGGNMILDKAREVLATEFPEKFETISMHLPDEKTRRVGQAVAAASLPRITK